MNDFWNVEGNVLRIDGEITSDGWDWDSWSVKKGSNTRLREALQKMTNALHQTEVKDKRQQTLMRALLPYLSPRRREKLERAMQLSHLTRLAGAAMQSGPFVLTDEEGFHV